MIDDKMIELLIIPAECYNAKFFQAYRMELAIKKQRGLTLCPTIPVVQAIPVRLRFRRA